MNAPTFSILIPVYNGERFLDEAIESLLQQSCEDFEICISDNCSNDSTSTICNRFLGDSRIRYSRSDRLLSLSENWLRVMTMASGRWLTVMGHDDVFSRNALERVAQSISRFPHGLVIVTNTEWVNETRQLLETRNPIFDGLEDDVLMPKMQFLDHLARGMVAPITGTFFHSVLITQYGPFDPRFRGGLDYEFMLRMCSQTDVILNPSAVAYYRIHGDQDTSPFNLCEHEDPELIMESVYVSECLSQQQKRIVINTSKMFMYRSVTKWLLANGKTDREVIAHRNRISSRIDRLIIRLGITELLDARPETWSNWCVWELSRFRALIPLLRVVIRWHVARTTRASIQRRSYDGSA